MSPVQKAFDSPDAGKHSKAINNHLLNKARATNDTNHLASPVTGGGVLVNRFCQLFMLSMQQGGKTPEDWAGFAWEILSRQGQTLLKDNKPLQGAQANIAELTSQANTFRDKQLPMLKALQVL
jgi:hypothetical protein